MSSILISTYVILVKVNCSGVKVSVALPVSYLDLLTGRSAPSVIFQLLFDEPHAETESQKHGPVPRGPAAEPSPEAGGLKLGCQALQRGAVVAVPRRQESLRLNGADRRAYTQTVSSELCYDSATGFKETQLKDRPAQLEPPANGVFHRHNLPGEVS